MEVMTKTIAITGASGNLGGRLVDYLLKTTDWNIVTFSSNPIEKWENEPRVRQFQNSNIGDVLPSLDVDILVHFAFARRFRSNMDIATSLDFAEKVYCAVCQNSKCKLINISTVGVYAPSETFIDENAPIGPDSLYGMAKYASEVLMRSMFSGHLDRTTILRLGGVAQSQRILPIFIENAKSAREINISGGGQLFSWIDVDDAISAIATALNMEKWQPIYNITLDKKRYSIIEVAQMVANQAKKLGYGDVKINITPQDIHLCVGWTSQRFIKDSGWQPQITIQDTIKKMFKNEE